MTHTRQINKQFSNIIISVVMTKKNWIIELLVNGVNRLQSFEVVQCAELIFVSCYFVPALLRLSYLFVWSSDNHRHRTHHNRHRPCHCHRRCCKQLQQSQYHCHLFLCKLCDVVSLKLKITFNSEDLKITICLGAKTLHH